MKANELRSLNITDLEDKVIELKKELFNLRFQLATGQLENQKKISFVKKDIARVKTLITEKERESVES